MAFPAPMLTVLPLLGIVLNGTSSVLYATVPDPAPRGDIGRGFALLYTGVIGAGGLAPIAYGAIADHNNFFKFLKKGLTQLHSDARGPGNANAPAARSL